MSQRTSQEPGHDDRAGLDVQIGRMAEDAARKFSGSHAEKELAKGNPQFGEKFHAMLAELASDQRIRLIVRNRSNLFLVTVHRESVATRLIKQLHRHGGGIDAYAETIVEGSAFGKINHPQTVKLNITWFTPHELGFSNHGYHSALAVSRVANEHKLYSVTPELMLYSAILLNANTAEEGPVLYYSPEVYVVNMRGAYRLALRGGPGPICLEAHGDSEHNRVAHDARLLFYRERNPQ